MQSCLFDRTGQESDPPSGPLGVSEICSAHYVVIALLGAVTLVGGSSDPSVPRSPGVTLQEKAGRPMGPSTLRCEFPWKLWWSMSGFCFWLFRFLSVLCDAVVISQGSVFCPCSFEPFTTRPVFGGCLRPSSSSSSSSVWFASSATFFFFFLSLSLRRWGTPNLFGLGFPLCFFILDTLSALDPYVFRFTYTQTLPRACFFRRRRSFPVRCFLVSCLVGRWSWWVFFLYLVLVFVGLLLCLCFLSWPSVAFFFFWVGGVRLAAFSLCFPLGSRGVGGGFACCFLASCISLARRFRLG